MEEELVKKRFRELADKAYNSNTYTFTGFLGLAEISYFYELERELCYVPVTAFGGSESCERVILRFGSEELFGYVEDFPITCLKIQPLMQKFADDLSHRDFLGALMNLGIERSVLGDIIIKDNEGYLFCTNAIAPYIVENLSRGRKFRFVWDMRLMERLLGIFRLRFSWQKQSQYTRFCQDGIVTFLELQNMTNCRRIAVIILHLLKKSWMYRLL